MDILQKLREILAEVLPEADLSSVTEDTRLGDTLGIDSLKMLQLMILTEDALHVRFPANARFETVGEVAAFIRSFPKD